MRTKLKLRSLAMLALGLITLAGCSKDSDNRTAPQVSTGEVTEVTSTTAKASGSIASDGGATVTEQGVIISQQTISESSPTGTSISASLGTSFNVALLDLAPNTKYYLRAYAKNEKGMAVGSEVTFTTKASLATVATNPPTDISSSKAKASCVVTVSDGEPITELGILYSTYANITIDSPQAIKLPASTKNAGTHDFDLLGLQPNTRYYVKSYAINSAGTSYGNEQTFMTSMSNISVHTVGTDNVTTTSVTVKAEVTSNGTGVVLKEKGVLIGTAQGLNLSTPNVKKVGADNAAFGSYSIQVTNLNTNTQYYIVAYASTSEETIYGGELAFVSGALLPTIATTEAKEIAKTSAIVGGNIISTGDGVIAERGIVYSTTTNPMLGASGVVKKTTTDTNNAYQLTLSGLSGNTTYYAKAYITNEQGTYYGDQISFVTLADLPQVVTGNIADITQSAAKVSGEVSVTDGAQVAERGFVYSTSNNPMIGSGSKVTAGAGTGSYSANLSGLTGLTAYYVRAYATTSAGTAYGEVKSFTTLAPPPQATIAKVYNIKTTEVTVEASISAAPGVTITERGIICSTTLGATLATDNLVKVKATAASTGTYTLTAKGLTANVNYYVRAYAVTSAGTVYSSDSQFISSLFAGGSGTASDPYLISTPEHLANIGSISTYSYYKLTNDIDLDIAPYNQDKGWEPIKFVGYLNGDGKIIKNLYINKTSTSSSTSYLGLFNETQFNYSTVTQIRNLGLVNVRIIGGSGTICAALVGHSYATIIENCFVTGELKGDSSAGGIVGYARSHPSYPTIVNNSYAYVNISSQNMAGGIVGYAESRVKVERCYTIGTINAKINAGGIMLAWATFSTTNYSTDNLAMLSEISGGTSVSRIGAFVNPSYKGSIQINNCYAFEGTVIKVGNSAGAPIVESNPNSADGKNKTKAECKSLQTYQGDLMWDFSGTWSFGNGEYSLPILKVFPASVQPNKLPDYLK